MKVSKVWYLDQFNMMERLPKSELTYIAENMNMVHIKKGNPILFAQGTSPYIYFVKTGILKVGTYTDEGQEDLKYLVKPGHIFGELALVGQGNPNDFAIAVEDCIFCLIDIPSMRELMRKYPDLNEAVLQLMGTRIRKLEKRLEGILFKTSRHRVLEFMLTYLEEFGRRDGQRLKIRNNLTFSDIAKLTSTSRQTVNSIMSELRRQETIHYDKDWIWMEEQQAPTVRLLIEEAKE